MTMQQNIGGSSPDTSGSGQAINYEKYLAMTEGLDLSEAEKRELIDTLWPMMQAFAIGRSSSEVASEACGELPSCQNQFTDNAADVVKSKDTNPLLEGDNKRGNQ